MSNEASKYTKSATVERAREMLKRLHDRNQRTWDDLDRDVAFAIESLIASAERYRFIANKMQVEQMQPVATLWRHPRGTTRITTPDSITDCDAQWVMVSHLYTAPPPRQPLTEEQAYDMGAKGGEPTESERLLFEAWMRGHCWKVCGTWDGKQYRSPTEVNGEVDYHAMHTRQLWAAWRDRAALEAAHGIKGEG